MKLPLALISALILPSAAHAQSLEAHAECIAFVSEAHRSIAGIEKLKPAKSRHLKEVAATAEGQAFMADQVEARRAIERVIESLTVLCERQRPAASR